jgi:hypothetical protein
MTSEPEVVWAFDLGKGSVGEAVRSGNELLHTSTLSSRQNLWNTRQLPRSVDQPDT